MQAILFALYFLTPRFQRSLSIRLLAVALLVMGTIKADQLYQMLGGFTFASEYGFLLLPFQWLMTPLLYFFVRSKTLPGFAFTRNDALHLLPFLAITLYYTSEYFLLSSAEKQSLLASGWLGLPVNRVFIPLMGDMTQLAYLWAALRLMNRFGVELKHWFSSVEKRELRWLRRIILIWVGIFFVHLFYVLVPAFGGRVPNALLVLDVMNIIHFLMVNVMALAAITDHFEASAGAENAVPMRQGYVAPALEPEDREKLFSRLEQFMTENHPYLDNDLTLKTLAEQLALTPRELSEVINAQAGRNFFDYVNRYRVDAAKQMLRQQPDARILDVAHACGFNSKSVFNEAFKRHAKLTPSAFRAAKTTP